MRIISDNSIKPMYVYIHLPISSLVQNIILTIPVSTISDEFRISGSERIVGERSNTSSICSTVQLTSSRARGTHQ